MEEKDISLDAVARLITAAAGAPWSLSAVRERNANGRNLVRVAVAMRTPDGRLYDVHGAVGGPEDWAGCEARLVEALRDDGWPLRPSEEETRLRLEVMGPDEAVAILKRYKADLDRYFGRAAEPDPPEEPPRAGL